METQDKSNPFYNDLKAHENDYVPHVVVVGTGLAGLSAALEAHRNGANVTLIEKEKRLGGNSAKATSGINGIYSSAQIERGIDDSMHFLEKDTKKAGGGFNNVKLVNRLVRGAQSAVKFLEDAGITLTELSQCGGHSMPRTHRLPPSQSGQSVSVGFMIIKLLSALVSMQSGITLIQQGEVKSISWETLGKDRYVTGVTYTDLNTTESHFIAADAIILTTGGTAYDRSANSLLAEFTPSLCTLPTTSGSHADGGGIRMAREIGAELVDMDKVQLHPTGLVHPANAGSLSKFLCPEAARGSGALLVNRKGKRFANELGTRGYLTSQIFEYCQPYEIPLDSGRDQMVAYLIMNEKAAISFGLQSLSFYSKAGLFLEFPDMGSFAAHFDIPLDELVATMGAYNAAALSGRDEFGREVFPVMVYDTREKVYAALVTPVIHYTMGGLKIDVSAEVQWTRSADGQLAAIGGLFAAGEATGGVHGADRLAGNSLLDCVVFGRLAGVRAAALSSSFKSTATTLPPALSTDTWTALTLRSKMKIEIDSTDHAPSPRSSRSRSRSTSSYYEISFELPSPFSLSGLRAGESVEVRATINGETVTRKYCPVSFSDVRGHIDFNVKLQPDSGVLSRYLYFMQIGKSLEFRRLAGTSLPLPLELVHHQESQRESVLYVARGPFLLPLVQVLRERLAAGEGQGSEKPLSMLVVVWVVDRAEEDAEGDPAWHWLKQTARGSGYDWLQVRCVLKQSGPAEGGEGGDRGKGVEVVPGGVMDMDALDMLLTQSLTSPQSQSQGITSFALSGATRIVMSGLERSLEDSLTNHLSQLGFDERAIYHYS